MPLIFKEIYETLYRKSAYIMREVMGEDPRLIQTK